MTNTEKTTQSFETTIEVCCHRVAIRYWGFDHELTDELIELLTEEGERRAHVCIVDGFHSGELHCLFYNGRVEMEISGWWEIKTD